MQRTVPGVESRCSKLVGRICLNDGKNNWSARIVFRENTRKKSRAVEFMRNCGGKSGSAGETKGLMAVFLRPDQGGRV